MVETHPPFLMVGRFFTPGPMPGTNQACIYCWVEGVHGVGRQDGRHKALGGGVYLWADISEPLGPQSHYHQKRVHI